MLVVDSPWQSILDMAFPLRTLMLAWTLAVLPPLLLANPATAASTTEQPFWPIELTQLAPTVQHLPASRADFVKWQQQGKQRLRQHYLWPDAVPVLQSRLTQRLDQGSYWREHWQLQLLTAQWQAVWLLLPKNASAAKPAPAVLLLHDHGAQFALGKDKWIRPLPSSPHAALAQRWADKYYSGQFFAESLVQAGFIVLAADTLGFGERGPINYQDQQQLAANFLARGRSLAGFTALEDLALAQFLAGQAAVRTDQITALGFSMGAYRVWQLAALSDHISAGVGIGWFNQFARLTEPTGNFSQGQTAFYMLHPGLLADFDLPQIAALAAPKPLLVVMGGQDPLMPRAGIEAGFSQLQQWYSFCQPSNKVAGKPELKLFPGHGHQFAAPEQAYVLAWLKRLVAPAAAKPVAGC